MQIRSKLARSLLLPAMLLAAGGAVAQNLDTMTREQLVAQAVKEGSVTIFSLSSRIARIEKAFESAYPGIDLIGLDMSSVKQIARLEAEQQAGVNAVDVLHLSDTPVVYDKLLKAGRVQNYVPPRVAGEIEPAHKAPLRFAEAAPIAGQSMVTVMVGDLRLTGMAEGFFTATPGDEVGLSFSSTPDAAFTMEGERINP